MMNLAACAPVRQDAAAKADSETKAAMTPFERLFMTPPTEAATQVLPCAKPRFRLK